MTDNPRAPAPVSADEVAALVVTYFPDAAISERIDLLLAQFGRIAMVDNGSDDASLKPLARYRGRISFHRNPANLGIATALNQGLRKLAAEGFTWVATFDQDSSVRPGFLDAMLETLNGQTNRDELALIGAKRIDPDNPIEHRWLRPRRGFPFFERVTCEEASKGVTLVITSGTLTSIAAFEQLGGFRDDLFIDLVDNEYCLRARIHGYRILVSCGAQLMHKVGNKITSRRMGLTVSATNHGALRKYYLFRNSIVVMKRHGRSQPHWLFYHLLSLGEVILGILFWERTKGSKLKACSLGLVDGLRGDSGPSARLWPLPRAADSSK